MPVRTVLVVDDDEAIRTLLRARLRGVFRLLLPLETPSAASP